MAGALARCSLLALVLIAQLVAVSCSAPRPARRDVVVGLVGEPSSVLSEEPNARIVASAVTEELVRRDAHDELVPRLAARVPTLENGGLQVVSDDPAAPAGRLVATFELRPGLTWQDGSPISAADVRFAWETERSAPLSTEARWNAERVERVDVLDAVSARFTYRANERWDDYALVAHVLPMHLLAGATSAQRIQYEREPMHAGPFAIAAWLPGIGITLSAFKGYALGAPALGRIEIRFFADRSALLDALRRGDVDVVPSPGLEADLARTLDRFADGTTLQTFYTPSESLEVLRYGPRFSDPALREAIELAVDRRAITSDLFAGRALVPRSFLVPPAWAAADLGAIGRVDRDAAREILQRAGYSRGTFGILERDGDRLIATITVVAGSPSRTAAARLVAGDLAAIGIALDVRERPAAEVGAAIAGGTFDLAVLPEPASDPQRAAERYAGVAGRWFDIVAQAAAASPDRTEKRVLYAELERIWDEARPGLPLYQRLLVDVVPRTLAGVQPAPDGSPLTWDSRAWRFGTP